MPRAAEVDVRVASYEKPDVTLNLYGWVTPRFTYERAGRRAARPSVGSPTNSGLLTVEVAS
jgi:hypothetical protein